MIEGKRGDSTALQCPHLTPISSTELIPHSSLLISITNAAAPKGLVTPLHPPSAHCAAAPSLPAFHTAFIPDTLPFSPCLLTHQNPACFIARSTLADRLEEMGEHLLQGRLMLVGGMTAAIRVVFHEGDQTTAFFLGVPNSGQCWWCFPSPAAVSKRQAHLVALPLLLMDLRVESYGEQQPVMLLFP